VTKSNVRTYLTCAVGSETETITFEGIPFPAEITAGAGGKPLSLL